MTFYADDPWDTAAVAFQQPAPQFPTPHISTPLYPEDMYATPPSMRMLDEQPSEDEPDLEGLESPHRVAQPPRRYDQTSSLHRQELPRRRRR